MYYNHGLSGMLCISHSILCALDTWPEEAAGWSWVVPLEPRGWQAASGGCSPDPQPLGAFAPWPQLGGTLSGCQCCFLYSVISFAAHWSQGRENEAKEGRAVTSTWKSFTLLSVVPGAAPSKEMKYSVFWPNKSCSLWVFLVKGQEASLPSRYGCDCEVLSSCLVSD